MANKTLTDVIGSSISDFAVDPATGKKRTPEEIIQAAVQAGLKEVPIEARGTSSGQPISDAQFAQTIIAQLANTAKREAPYLAVAKAVSNAINNPAGGARASLLNDPSKWSYAKDLIGKTIDDRLFLDPNQKTLTKEQLAQYQAYSGMGGARPEGNAPIFTDPITGQQLNVNPSTGEIAWGSDINQDPFGYMGAATGNIGLGYSNGSGAGLPGAGGTGTGNLGTGTGNLVASDGKSFTNYSDYMTYQQGLDQKKEARQSAYDLLYSQFKQYGLESLVEPLKNLIQKDISPSQFTIELRNSPEYQKRFAANALRVKAGYKALDEGTYLALEDSYQKLMKNYGLPNSYWATGELGVQPGFEKLIAGNVDPVELEQRLQLAVDQIDKGPKEYMNAIKEFYPEISRGDLMAYVLDPDNALKSIQSKVKAAQVGGEYLRAGLGTNVGRAEYLTQQGVTADQARGAIPTLKELGQRGGELADIYARQGLGPYDIATAEEEMYNLGKAAEAKKKREKLTALEQSSFSGKTGVGALESGRAGLY